MKPADANRQTGAQKRPRQVDGAWELVRLDPDQSDEGTATGSVNHTDDPVGPDAAVGFVIGVDADRHIRSKHLAPARVFGEAVEAGERVRRDRRLDPPDRIAVVVVMRRLDQHQMEDRGVVIGRGCPRGLGQIGRSLGQANQRSEGQNIANYRPQDRVRQGDVVRAFPAVGRGSRGRRWGESPSERHLNGDELVEMIEGATFGIIAADRPPLFALTGGRVVAVPQGAPLRRESLSDRPRP